MAGTKMNFDVSEDVILTEVKVISPSTFSDNRGFLYTDYLEEFFNEQFELNFNHSKTTVSSKGVLRGIHGDFKTWKLINCTYGEITQVVVDCRPDSETYRQWQKFKLSYRQPKFILVPPGFGNAFFVHSDVSVYNYKLSYSGAYSDFDEQFTFKWNDKNFDIDWGFKDDEKIITSKRDKV